MPIFKKEPVYYAVCRDMHVRTRHDRVGSTTTKIEEGIEIVQADRIRYKDYEVKFWMRGVLQMRIESQLARTIRRATASEVFEYEARLTTTLLRTLPVA